MPTALQSRKQTTSKNGRLQEKPYPSNDKEEFFPVAKTHAKATANDVWGTSARKNGKKSDPWVRFLVKYCAVPERNIALHIQRVSPDTVRIGIPATALDGVHDAFLCIDYLGDVGSAYLDGSLVSDHFANGSPWEFGLKRFMVPGTDRELIVRISPLQQNATTLHYFPPDTVLQSVSDGTFQVEVHSITVVPEYHAVLTQRR